MSDFSPTWLALRESADVQARCVHLAEQLAGWLAARPTPAPDASLNILDLGCGTGSNLRWLAPRLHGRQAWTCLDRDPALLAALPHRTAAWARERGLEATAEAAGLRINGDGFRWDIAPRAYDLAQSTAGLNLKAGTLVTAAALLDLVSESWLLGLLRAAAAAGSPLLLALTYDGRVGLEPRHRVDGPVIGLVNAHQRRDKSLGSALGPSASARLAYLARTLGFTVEMTDSDWLLTREQTALQEALVAGWAAAATEQSAAELSPDQAAERTAVIADWRDTRLGWIGTGDSQITVGHQDALLLPP
ncbi:class I SAM-dependent methyltransferase [uncultured Lamprocystis sp.]|jgi:SAM-dependent methyltransferase|uniref:class I SAM-dependent methyltransferase n=1 Tax=uncultured Lamprocystis sp. TaxID=543132 RepID=UPI0025DDC086|nr:class I SAM-dependent methyltransferase [uncultured Lamprocystis sp.]